MFNPIKDTEMSVCVIVKTRKLLKADDLFDYLGKGGEQLAIASDEYPFLKFGTQLKALRGIEVNKENGAYEVRVCTFASVADYLLFARTVHAVMALTGGKAYLEDEEKIENPQSQFDGKWIGEQRERDLSITRALIMETGQPIVMDGLVCKFCIGPKMYQEFNIPESGSYRKEYMDNLQGYLCNVQWHCVSLEDTSTNSAIPSPSGDPDDSLSVSIISIRDGKVDEFDYVSEASVLGIVDMDNENNPPALIPFREAWKILPDEVFRPLDELQFIREGEVTVEMVREIMDNARRLQPDDLHHKPCNPGEGFDELQNTVILMWNPAISSVTLEDHRNSIAGMLTGHFNWSVWEHDKARCGDRFFLVKIGEGRTGIVMSGIFDSQPYRSEDWSGRGRRTFYMDMLPNIILDPDMLQMLDCDKLCEIIPSFDWRRGHSGRLLTKEEARVLESLWEEYLQKVAYKADGKIMRILNRHKLV